MKIKIAKVNVSNNKLTFKLDYSKALRWYFLKDIFFVEYDIDVSNVDKSILVLPIISVVAPIAWAVGADIEVDRIDETYLQSLSIVRDVFKQFYPQFSYSGNIHVGHAASNQFDGNQVGLLFTGGLDSLTSYLRHKDEKPELISVWGLDIPHYEEKFINKVRDRIGNLVSRDKLNFVQVKTDMRYNINEELLSREFKVEWIGEVAHGLFLLSLCAPLSAVDKIGTVIIASSYTKEFGQPWGSDPLIDENVRWADTKVIHDAFELSRQEKLHWVSKNYPEYLRNLRVCNSTLSNFNCTRCEKCARTIVGLTLEGIDPRSCGFDIGKKHFDIIKDCLLKGRFDWGKDQEFMWMDIQKHITEKIGEDLYDNVKLHSSNNFLRWLRDFNFSTYRVSRLQRLLWTVYRRFYNNKTISVPLIKRYIKSYLYVVLAQLFSLFTKKDI